MSNYTLQELRDHAAKFNCRIVIKNQHYNIYRIVNDNAVFVAKSASFEALESHVVKVTGEKVRGKAKPIKKLSDIGQYWYNRED